MAHASVVVVVVVVMRSCKARLSMSINSSAVDFEPIGLKGFARPRRSTTDVLWPLSLHPDKRQGICALNAKFCDGPDSHLCRAPALGPPAPRPPPAPAAAWPPAPPGLPPKSPCEHEAPPSGAAKGPALSIMTSLKGIFSWRRIHHKAAMKTKHR